jgi:kynurenine formamidase
VDRRSPRPAYLTRLSLARLGPAGGTGQRTDRRRTRAVEISKRVIRTDQGAPPLGAYSQAWRAGDFVFVSGTGPIGPDGKVEGNTIEEQTAVTIDNIASIGDGGSLRFTADFLGVEFHGDAHSHIDALCHVVYQGRLYNGLPVEQAVTSVGASSQTMDVARNGLVSRGVLLDIPRLRGTAWVEPGEALLREELEAAERSQGVRMGQGDLVVLRTGHARKRLDEGPWDAANAKAGVHTTAMPLFRERRSPRSASTATARRCRPTARA